MGKFTKHGLFPMGIIGLNGWGFFNKADMSSILIKPNLTFNLIDGYFTLNLLNRKDFPLNFPPKLGKICEICKEKLSIFFTTK